MIAQIVVFSRKTNAQRQKNFAFRSAKIAQNFCEWKPYFLSSSLSNWRYRRYDSKWKYLLLLKLLCMLPRVSIRKTFAQFLRNETQNFSFFLREKKQQFAQSFAKVILRKIALFRLCETQVLRNSANRVLRNSAISSKSNGW